MLELPAYFQPDSAATISSDIVSNPKKLVELYEKTTLSLAIHSRMLRLHRPWLSRGYEDERFAYSKEQCIRAARASLRMMSDTSGVARFLEKWWIPLFYVTVSGMVVIIDLLKTAKRDMKSKVTDDKISEVKSALDQMRQIDSSVPAKAAVKVMDFLMSEVEERRRGGTSLSHKRKYGEGEDGDDEEHNVQRVVKRLIRQAQLETDSSPSSSAPFASPSADTAQPSPHGGRMEPTPEKPVFGAYPMPSAQPQQPQQQPPQDLQTNTGNIYNNLPFNVDNQPFNQNQFQNGSQLDPAVESMLASYFPQPATDPTTIGPAGASQVPDDFLSRVFSFSWDTSNQNQNAQNNQAMQTPTSATSQPTPQTINGVQPPQPQRQDSMSGMQYGAFDWQSHQWMA